MTVYFIRRRNDQQGLIKIGVSVNVERRVYAMTTAHPEGFDVICTVDGGKGLEAYLHERFADDRVMREWFRPSSDLLKLVADIERIGVMAIPEFAREELIADASDAAGRSYGASEAARCLQYLIERHSKYASDLQAVYRDVAFECGITFWAVKHLISGRAKELSIDKFDGIKRAYLNHLLEERKAIDARIEREQSLSGTDFAGEISIMQEVEALAEKVRQAKQGR